MNYVISYLEILKYDKFITNFRKNYKENIDYIIIKNNNTKKVLNKQYSFYYACDYAHHLRKYVCYLGQLK